MTQLVDQSVILTNEQLKFLRTLAANQNNLRNASFVDLKELEQVFPIVLGSYKATFNQSDLICLEILRVIERSGVDFTRFTPIVWSEYGKKCYGNLKNFGVALYNRPSINDLLQQCIDADLMLKSSLKIPLRLKIDNDTLFFDTMNDRDLYDPRFLLPLFNGFFISDTVINCKLFIRTNCLRYTLAYLSLKDQLLRKCAYSVLFKFRHYLTSSGVKFEEKSSILHLLTTLKNSLDAPNLRLPPIITCFLGRTFWILVHPRDKMFCAISSYILLKPQLDLKNIPEFYKLFHSSSTEDFLLERHWILQLMEQGLREFVDFKIFQGRFAFKLLLSFFVCKAMCDKKSKQLILGIVHSASRIKRALNELCFNYNLLAWILSNVNDVAKEDNPFLFDFARILVDIRKGLKEIGEKAWNVQKMAWISCGHALLKNWNSFGAEVAGLVTELGNIIENEKADLEV